MSAAVQVRNPLLMKALPSPVERTYLGPRFPNGVRDLR